MFRMMDGCLEKMFFTSDDVILSVLGVIRVLMCCKTCVSSRIVSGASLVLFGGVCVCCLMYSCSGVCSVGRSRGNCAFKTVSTDWCIEDVYVSSSLRMRGMTIGFLSI